MPIRRTRCSVRRVAIFTLSLAATAATFAADWPQWRGPKRNGLCTETGLLSRWPQSGPKQLWKITGLGKGYSSVSIIDGKLFTMGQRPNEEGGRDQVIIAYDLETQKELWTATVGRPHKDGPRCTPTVDGELLYAIGTDGDLVCVESATGNERWRKSFARDFRGRMMSGWKFSESPLVDGNKLVCTPGGSRATIVALDKNTGETIWKSAVPQLGRKGRDGAGYSSPVISRACGVRQYVQMLGRGLVGVSADNGKFLWGSNRVANSTANISTPIVGGDYVFGSSAYGTGSVLLKLHKNGGKIRAEEVYFLNERTFQNHHGGMVKVGKHIYGGHGHNRGEPVCVLGRTGEVAWKDKGPGSGSAAVLYADGHVYFRYDNSTVALIEANPRRYKLKGSFRANIGGRGPAWAHPVIHNARLYLRHGDALACYDIKAR